MAAITTQTLIQPGEVINGGILKQTPLNSRFDISLVAPHIADAERMHVVPVLGETFYDALILKKDGAISNYNTAVGAVAKAFPEVADAAFEALWTKLLMSFCAWAVYYETLPFVALQAGSNGVFIPGAEQAQNAGVQGAKFLQDQAKRRLQSLSEALEKYLCANAANFTDYDNSNCPEAGCSTETENKTINRFGLMYVTNN